MDDANRGGIAPPTQPHPVPAQQPAAPAAAQPAAVFQAPPEPAPPASASYWASAGPAEPAPPASSAYQTPEPTFAYPAPEPTSAFPPAPPAGPDRVSSPVLRHHRAIAAAAVLVIGGLAVVGWRVHYPHALFGSAAPPALAWTPAQGELPADATRTGNQYALLNDVACASADSCVAVGVYDTGSTANVGHGLIETLSGGFWRPASAPLTVPGASKVNFVDLDGVSCPSAGNCVAVGSYWDTKSVSTPLIETGSGSAWVPAKAPLPADADPNKGGFLSEVACPADGTCVATGWYTDTNGNALGMIDTMAGSTWTSTQAPLPFDAKPSPIPTSGGIPTTDLAVIRCAGVGDCVSTGNYTDQTGSMQPLIETLSGGTWTAGKGPLPGDAAQNPTGFLWSIACQAPGSCVAGGHYNSRSSQSRDFVATQSGGTWTPAAVPLPADAAATQTWNPGQITGLTAAACQAVGTCLEAGSYFARNGALEGMIEALSGGTWTAQRAPLPDGAAGAKQIAFFDSAACPTSSACFAVGGYKAADGSTQTLIETAAPK